MTLSVLGRTALAGLTLGWVLVGCGDDNHRSPTGPSTSQSVISNLKIRPLTGEFSDRNVQYLITTTVTNPAGVVGGTAQLKTAATAEVRRRTAALVGQVVSKAPIAAQNVVGDQLRVTLGFNRPPVGVMHLDFSVVDARGLESNAIPLVIGIAEPPPPPPEPPSPPPPRPPSPPPPPKPGPSFAETVGRTFQHPRCVNCHGFKVPNTTGNNHVARPTTCSSCHTVPGWGAPPSSLSLAGKSLSQICNQVKVSRGNNAALIDEHLKHDALILWAISDGTVLGNLRPGGKAPPGDVGAWSSLVTQWTGGGLRCD
jgi:hypothetical protein